MNYPKIYVTSSLFSRTEVAPVISGAFGWEKENNRAYYRHKSKDKFKFSKKADYNLLMLLQDDECAEVSVEVERYRNGAYETYWLGIFALSDCTVNESKCWVEVTPDPDDAYTCFEDVLSDSINIYSGAAETVLGDFGEYETTSCVTVNSAADCTDFYNALYSNNDSCIDTNEWCVKENIVRIDGIQKQWCDATAETFFLTHETIWHRVVVETDCSHDVPVAPTFGSGWSLLENNCLVDQTAKYWKCPAGSSQIGPYTRGRVFSEIINNIVGLMGCGLKVKSDFFNIGPLGDAPSNFAYTYATDYLHNMTVHQKSDIKRPNTTNGSNFAAWDLKPKDWFEDLLKMFNVWFIIEDGTLVLEHYSFFTSVADWDLSQNAMDLQYDFSGNENVKTELFYWADENVSSEFKANPIKYTCGSEEREQRCALITTDLEYMADENNHENIADEGFVLIANTVLDDQYYVIDNNQPLSWPSLHEALHLHGRLYKSGIVNNIQQDFVSWRPYKKQEPFNTKYTINNVDFDANNLKTTRLGDGEVADATHNILTCSLKLQLNY